MSAASLARLRARKKREEAELREFEVSCDRARQKETDREKEALKRRRARLLSERVKADRGGAPPIILKGDFGTPLKLRRRRASELEEAFYKALDDEAAARPLEEAFESLSGGASSSAPPVAPPPGVAALFAPVRAPPNDDDDDDDTVRSNAEGSKSAAAAENNNREDLLPHVAAETTPPPPPPPTTATTTTTHELLVIPLTKTTTSEDDAEEENGRSPSRPSTLTGVVVGAPSSLLLLGEKHQEMKEAAVGGGVGKIKEVGGPVLLLFDHLIVVGLPSRMLDQPSIKIGARYQPRVLHHFSATGEAFDAESITDFCLPAGAKVRACADEDEDEPEVTEVIFVLSGGGRDGSKVQYGMCAHTIRRHEFRDRGRLLSDCCYCLITSLLFAPLHFAFLRAMLGAHRARPSTRRFAQFDETLRRFAAVPVPAPGATVDFDVESGGGGGGDEDDDDHHQRVTRPVRWARKATRAGRLVQDEPTMLARQWAVPILLSRLTLENVLLILGCALVEQQICFVSQDLQALSACVLALVSMLRPLRWAGPLISALPATLADYLDSPVPVILGVHSLPLHFVHGDDMILVFVDEDRIRFAPRLHGDPSKLLAVQLPKMSQLRHDLADDEETLRPWLVTSSAANANISAAARSTTPSLRPYHALPPLDHVTSLDDPKAVSSSHEDLASPFRGSFPAEPSSSSDKVLDAAAAAAAAARGKSAAERDGDGDGDDADSVRSAFGGDVDDEKTNELEEQGPSPGWTCARPPQEALDALERIIDSLELHVAKLVDVAERLDKQRAQAADLAGTSKRSRPLAEDDDEGAPRRESSSRALAGYIDGRLAEVRLSPSAEVQKEWWYGPLGEAGLDFVARFVETQMFSNLRQEAEKEAARAAATTTATASARDLLAAVHEVARLDEMPAPEGHHHFIAPPAPAPAPPPPAEERYVAVIHWPEARRPSTNAPDDAPRVAATLQAAKLFGLMVAGGAAEEEDDKEEEAAADARGRPLIEWCNGQCDGRMDTELCTALCVQLWDQEVAAARGRRTKATLQQTSFTPVEPRRSQRRVPEPERHPAETNGQYALRCAMTRARAKEKEKEKKKKKKKKKNMPADSTSTTHRMNGTFVSDDHHHHHHHHHHATPPPPPPPPTITTPTPTPTATSSEPRAFSFGLADDAHGRRCVSQRAPPPIVRPKSAPPIFLTTAVADPESAATPRGGDPLSGTSPLRSSSYGEGSPPTPSSFSKVRVHLTKAELARRYARRVSVRRRATQDRRGVAAAVVQRAVRTRLAAARAERRLREQYAATVVQAAARRKWRGYGDAATRRRRVFQLLRLCADWYARRAYNALGAWRANVDERMRIDDELLREARLFDDEALPSPPSQAASATERPAPRRRRSARRPHKTNGSVPLLDFKRDGFHRASFLRVRTSSDDDEENDDDDDDDDHRPLRSSPQIPSAARGRILARIHRESHHCDDHRISQLMTSSARKKADRDASPRRIVHEEAPQHPATAFLRSAGAATARGGLAEASAASRPPSRQQSEMSCASPLDSSHRQSHDDDDHHHDDAGIFDDDDDPVAALVDDAVAASEHRSNMFVSFGQSSSKSVLRRGFSEISNTKKQQRHPSPGAGDDDEPLPAPPPPAAQLQALHSFDGARMLPSSSSSSSSFFGRPASKKTTEDDDDGAAPSTPPQSAEKATPPPRKKTVTLSPGVFSDEGDNSLMSRDPQQSMSGEAVLSDHLVSASAGGGGGGTTTTMMTTRTMAHQHGMSFAKRLAEVPSIAYDDIDFRATLREGFVCVKHSRRGPPQRKVVSCGSSADFSHIEWKDPPDERLTMRQRARRLLRTSGCGHQAEPRSIDLEDVVAIKVGVNSKVLARAERSGHLVSFPQPRTDPHDIVSPAARRRYRQDLLECNTDPDSPYCTMSIVTSLGQTLDLEFDSKDSQLFMIKGFRKLVEATQAIHRPPPGITPEWNRPKRLHPARLTQSKSDVNHPTTGLDFDDPPRTTTFTTEDDHPQTNKSDKRTRLRTRSSSDGEQVEASLEALKAF